MARKTTNNKRSGRHWTREEVDYVLDHYSRTPLRIIAYHLERSESGVQRKLDNLLGSRRLNVVDGLLTTKELSEILGVDSSTVSKWIKNLGFPAKSVKKELTDKKVINTHIYYVNPSDVWKWLKDNKDRIVLRTSRIKRGFIVPEPQWLIDDIENKVVYGNINIWNDKKLCELYTLRMEKGLKLRECAEHFKVSLPAIQKQMKKINNMKLSELKRLQSLTRIA